MVIDCLKMLSEYEFDAGNYLSAINYAQMIISYDHLDEHAYEIVVRSFIERKQMGQAMKLSQKIKNVFLRELKSEPQFLKSLKFFS
jgi:two-component SAPR family response regulator